MRQATASLQQPQWSRDSLEDNYVLRSKIVGQGAFSKVYLGSSISKSEDVAIKIMDRTKLTKEEEDRLVAEVSILRELSSHENILVLHDTYAEPESYRLVFEYMNGGDLLDILEEQEKSCIGEMNARHICLSLMSAITHLHLHSIAHRDIKPENILFSWSDQNNFVIKLADFGFAKKEATPNCLATLCGTPAYVAPEILLKRSYGLKCDLWSASVLAFVLMGGYQPFQGTSEDELKRKIVKGSYRFDGKYWSNITDSAKDFISLGMAVDPDERPSAEDMMTHSWFSEEITDVASSENNDEKPVFFMIGSQRSGSNWLRTMLDQREDLIGPHPPHVMRDFMPIISKFGDLSDDENFCILLDHVCTFVERNQVPWNDKYGQSIRFCRKTVYDQAKASCERLQLQGHELDNELYLLSVFDALMNFFAEANGKDLWMCKSMGMSAYHKSLLKFYGQRRLRYIYLVRDPRDVAMSFMNTPVGDKHYYPIVKKWVKLQEQALAIVEDTPNLLLNIKYEEILENKEDIIASIYDFIGDQRFGGIKRQASVMSIAPVSESVNQAKRGRESCNAQKLSQQFENLCRGESFAKEQMEKWRHPEKGLKKDDLMIIESLAYDAMDYFGYKTAHVKIPADALQFTEAQQNEFARINEANINKMLANLKKENIGDYNRRIFQASVLKLPNELLTAAQDWTLDLSSKTKKDLILKKIGDYSIVQEYTEKGMLEFGSFVCGAASQKGYYPSDPMKENQDSFDIRITANATINHFFGVYDGHGPQGERCSRLCKEMIGDIFEEDLSNDNTQKVSLTHAHEETHRIMTNSASINAESSGTTSVVATISGSILTIAYVGDSGAIIGSKSYQRPSMFLTNPHDLSRSDEVARIERKGGLIMSTEEYDEIKRHLTKVSSNSLAKSISSKSLNISDREHSDRRGGLRRGSALAQSRSESMSDLMKCVTGSHIDQNRGNPMREHSRRRSRGLTSSMSASNLSVKKSTSNQVLRDIIQKASINSLVSYKTSQDEEYVSRIWCPESVDKLPGCAFTRSLGDSVAHDIGVSAKPEFKQVTVQNDDVIIIASDGVTDYLDAAAIVDIVKDIEDPSDAAKVLVMKSAELWADRNDYCDDITAIVIFVSINKSDEDSDDGGILIE